jgi:hypothetical protein
MAKKGISIITVLVVLALFAGCASAPPDLGVYDTSVPSDQLVTLEIAGGLKVTAFDGSTVSWGENGTAPGEDTLSSNAWRAQMGGSKYKTTIKIPAGTHKIDANLYLWDYNAMPGHEVFSSQRAGYIRASGLEVSYDFQAGHIYFLRPVLICEIFGKQSEQIDYNNSGPTASFKGAKLRIDENGSS